ncbi:sulfite oxidase heme-binding subunit YedZ [Acidovorax radicis]|jgi:sulfoxide reductase heme-binding subunit YedZ|uniref:sulfite oxidase heme-binding subunit YedZ n=1 Tax=Acidovorax radicis TaxID=758826 RepID=UPI001CF89639|nr:protein-methionine-sulfoxide reductase heme-binding subunit MsrQ [Acidovorax radicis]UCU98510.1 sulfoxide reductase heme-binding subunit YedZ [Acidovorax radicis]
MRKLLLHPAAKPAVFMAYLLPLAWLIYAAVADQLGANPAEALIRATGDWTLRSLCLVLAVTPLRVLTSTPQLARFRRMLGLFVFFYGVLHLLSYSWFDMGFDLAEIARDIAKRPFILVGSLALLLLALLAATSFHRAIKVLGGKRWQALHRAVYGVAALAILHFFWMRAGKNNFGEVAVYAAILGALLGWRALRALHKHTNGNKAPSGTAALRGSATDLR